MLPVFRPSMGKAEADAVAAVLASGWIGLGPKTAEFEAKFAKYLDVPHAVGVNSATAALDLATILAGVGPGDEVIVPTMTFVSTAHAVIHRGARVVFADVEPDTLNISFSDVARKLTPRTKAIIPVHYAGRAVDVARLKQLVGERVTTIEDCAHATGAIFDGRRVGAAGNLACFSFHAVKNLAMGDGGALVTPSEEQADRARRLRWLGIDRDTWTRTGENREYWWRYNVTEIGEKCHMNDIAAAIGIVQLARLDAMNARRREIAEMYTQSLADIVQTPPPDTAQSQSSWHIYCIQCDRRDDLSMHLASHGISTGVHYFPIHLYDQCYGRQPALPTAEAAFERILSLPMFPDMADEQVTLVANHIRKFFGK